MAREQSNFDDNLEDFLGGPVAPRIVQPAAADKPLAFTNADYGLDEDGNDISDTPPTAEFIEICKKCNGRGKFTAWSGRSLGECFACRGTGKFVRKTSPEDRKKDRQYRTERKQRLEREAREAFAAAHPKVAEWMERSRHTFPFAASMHEALGKYGSLTEKQLDTCVRMIARWEERAAAMKAEAEARAASAPSIDTDRLMSALKAAKAAKLKYPKMRFDGFVASLAPDTGKNAGAIYLKSGDTYLGKIAGGKLFTSGACSDVQRDGIVAAMNNPLTSAVAYGRQTGTCSCCGRALENEESVRLGIGPICREKFSL